ncbi:membrane dipeptidase-domain-containing protein [Crepidotus variabilis]|uniref:Dipeptidase n=1 Tax=Crepidotus variabilis TaxID=179855 RepID=A0A9P6EGW7_9AGAR|nr:membrane dipeptidase-domain-containing protein [Crepidotus variabilis]
MNRSRDNSNERSPLLNTNGHHEDDERTRGALSTRDPKSRIVVWSVLTLVFIAALVVLVGFEDKLGDSVKGWLGILPKNPTKAAIMILDKAPVIDGHIDLPALVRYKYANNVSAIDLNRKMPGHVDIPRLKKGKVGGFFWSTYVSCPKPDIAGKNFLGASWKVRDTLEQIDVSKLLIEKYPETFSLALNSGDVKNAISGGKIASLLGVEGGHQLGNSIAVLRQYHALGVRYLTLTHTCHNAFADSCGLLPGIIPLHYGLSPLGRSLIGEMNRLGVLVDLSHTSDDTARQALNHSKAPVIWSHSSARAVHEVPRNVPDDILKLIGRGANKTDAVVMVNFAPFFIAYPGEADLYAVADHVDHIARIAGKEHVGLGSDFDGIGEVPEGLEDVSKYPALIAELYRRGWNKYELAGLTGGNLLRVMEGAEEVAKELQTANTRPVFDIYSKRKDLPPRASEEDL